MKFVKENLIPILCAVICVLMFVLNATQVRFAPAELPAEPCPTEVQPTETEASAPTGNPDWQTVLDADGVLVQYCGIDLSGDPSLLLFIENHREDTISYYVDDFAINGYMVSIFNDSEEIAPGESYDTADYGQPFDLEDLGYYEVNAIEEISFLLNIRIEYEDSCATILEEAVHIQLEEPVEICVEPIAIPTERTVLVDTEDAYVEFCGIDTRNEYSWRVDLYVENRSDTSQWWYLDDVRINDCYTMIWNDPQPIGAGLRYRTVAKHEAVFDPDDLMRYGVDKITKLEFTLVDLDSSDRTGTKVCIDNLCVPLPTGKDTEEVPDSKCIYTGNGLTVSCRGFYSRVYTDNYTHDYYLSLMAETGRSSGATITVGNLRIDGADVQMTRSSIYVPADCAYLSDANLKMEFCWDAWDAAGNMEYKKVEFDMYLEYKDTVKTIPVCIYASELA